MICSVKVDLMIVMSSTIFAVCGNSSLIHAPDFPYCAKLNFEAELHHAGRKRLAAQHPAPAIGQRRGKVGEQAVALFVAEALYIKRLHSVI